MCQAPHGVLAIMILVMESDILRLRTLLQELYRFTDWEEAFYLDARLALAEAGYPVNAVAALKEPEPEPRLATHLVLEEALRRALAHDALPQPVTDAHTGVDT